jgi:hypothetical protein
VTRWTVALLVAGVSVVLALSYAVSAGALGTAEPSQATVTTLVQGIQLEIRDPSSPTTTPTTQPTTAPTSPSTPRQPQVGGVVVTPLDPGSNRGAGGGPAAPEVQGRELVRTGASSTVVLLVIGLGLLDIGWLARTAVPANLRRRGSAAPRPAGALT